MQPEDEEADSFTQWESSKDAIMKYYVMVRPESGWTYIGNCQRTNTTFNFCYYRPLIGADGEILLAETPDGHADTCKKNIREGNAVLGIDFFADDENELVRKVTSDKELAKLYRTWAATNQEYQNRKAYMEPPVL